MKKINKYAKKSYYICYKEKKRPNVRTYPELQIYIYLRKNKRLKKSALKKS